MSAMLYVGQRRFMMLLHRLQQSYHRIRSTPVATLLQHVATASTPSQIDQAVNALQRRIWHLSTHESGSLREQLINALIVCLRSTPRPRQAQGGIATRISAAEWLRVLTQTGLTPQPQTVFVTLVTVAARLYNDTPATPASRQELQAYLETLHECFWAFRYPYPAYAWEMFPANHIFYELAPLLPALNQDMQEVLLTIFGELPHLDDREITTHLLPLALSWSQHPEADYRRRIALVLARMSDERAQEALQRLQIDADPAVRTSAKHAAYYVRKN